MEAFPEEGELEDATAVGAGVGVGEGEAVAAAAAEAAVGGCWFGLAMAAEVEDGVIAGGYLVSVLLSLSSL